MTLQSDRRQFLGRTGAILAASLLPDALGSAIRLPAVARGAAPRTAPRKKTLVVLYQRGGADALNVIVPYANKLYYDARPTIAIPEKTTEEDPGVIPLTKQFGMNPAMEALLPFWESQKFAAILGVGSPHPTRSHFDAQDFMEYASPGDRTIASGWLNRYLAHTRSPANDRPMRGLALQQLLPRSLRGREPVLAVPSLRRRDSEGLLDLFDDVYRPGASGGGMGGGTAGSRAGAQDVVRVGRDTIEVLRGFWDVVEKAPASGVKYPNNSLARQLATLAKVLKHDSGLEVAALDVPSWDHHQGETRQISERLGAVAGALRAFADDLGDRFADVLILVMTEFGRNVGENGNRGTDHGHGGCMLALGGTVQGGIYGDYGTLKTSDLYQSRDLHADIDFRTVFKESLAGLFGFDPPKEFFPRWDNPRRLGFLRPA